MTTKKPRLDIQTLEEIAPLIRNVAHPLRLYILDYLQHEGAPKTVSEITEAAGSTQSVVSQHLRVLKDQGVLFSKRQGNYVLYGIEEPDVLLILDCIRKHAAKKSGK